MNFEQTDVIFVIEKSLSFKKYLNEILEDYIIPTLSCFSGGVSEEIDVFFTQSSQIQYAVVFFGSELTVLGSSTQIESLGPTTSQNSVIASIRNANYSYKNTNRQAYIYEALQTASEIFKTLSGSTALRENSKRCLILLTQSSPLCNPWGTMTPDSILSELKMMGIKTSIISAHKILELYKLYDAAGGDQKAITHKNYSIKPQHLVLLNGFILQERPVSPSLTNQQPSVMNVATPPTQMNMPSTPSNMPTQSPSQPHTGSPVPSQNQMIMVRPPGNGMNPVSTLPQPMAGAAGSDYGMCPTQNMPNMMNPQVPNMPMNPRQRWPIVGNGQQQMINNPQQQLQQQQMTAGNGSQMINNAPQQQQMQQLQQQPMAASPTIIWQGTLDWSEKKLVPGGVGGIQRIPCKISSQPMNGKLDIKTDGWPSSLQMLLVQKNLLSSVGNTYFQNIHKVMFYPEPCPALDSLTTSLSQGYAGVVHLSSNLTDIKMIILLFSPDKKAYVGFIPLDQIAFVSKIKQVFQNQSRNSQSQSINKPPMNPNMIQTVNASAAGNSTPTNVQMMTSSTGVMNVPSQSNVVKQQNPQMNQAMTHGGNMTPGTPMVSSQMGGQQVLTMNQAPQMMGGHVSQVNTMGTNQSVLVNNKQHMRPTINISGQQQPTDQMQMRQTMHPSNIRHQQQMQVQQQTRPNLSVNAQPRTAPPAQMRQILQQQRLQHQQQQQQQQQQMLLMHQQQNMRPQMNQQVMGAQQQVMNQQGMVNMGQQGMVQHQSMGGQQAMTQGIGQPMQDSNSADCMDFLGMSSST